VPVKVAEGKFSEEPYPLIADHVVIVATVAECGAAGLPAWNINPEQP